MLLGNNNTIEVNKISFTTLDFHQWKSEIFIFYKVIVVLDVISAKVVNKVDGLMKIDDNYSKIVMMINNHHITTLGGK